MLGPIDNWFLSQEEPAGTVLSYLRKSILSMSDDITESWSYAMPFYYYRGRRFCYLRIDRNTGWPYIGIVDGNRIKHPGLERGTRSRMKIMLIDPRKDIPRASIDSLMKKILSLYK